MPQVALPKHSCEDDSRCSCCDGCGVVAGYGDCPLCDGAGFHKDRGGDPISLGFDAVAAAFMEAGPEALLVSRPVPFVVEAVRGCGFGARAACDLVPGDLIVAERPLVIVAGTEAIRRRVMEDSGALVDADDVDGMRMLNELAAADAEMLRTLSSALDAAGSEARASFLALADSFSDSRQATVFAPGSWVDIVAGDHVGCCGYVVHCEEQQSSAGDGPRTYSVCLCGSSELLHGVPAVCMLTEGRTLGGIFFTNAVGTRQGDLSYVYAQSSRLNHSCRPNATFMERDGARYIYAAASVERGEELCISYAEDYGSVRNSEIRSSIARVASLSGFSEDEAEALAVGLFRQKLLIKWGFECRCRRCAVLAPQVEMALERWRALEF